MIFLLIAYFKMDPHRGFEPPVSQRPRIQSPIARPTSGAGNSQPSIKFLANWIYFSVFSAFLL